MFCFVKIFQFYLNVADCGDDEWRERDNPPPTFQGYSLSAGLSCNNKSFVVNQDSG